MQGATTRHAPFFGPAVIREAALQFIDEVENGRSFPLLASGSLILGPSGTFDYQTWDAKSDHLVKELTDIFHGPTTWDRSTFLLAELMFTLISDPSLWFESGISPSCRVLDPHRMETVCLRLVGRYKARTTTPKEVRDAIKKLPDVQLGTVEETPFAWSSRQVWMACRALRLQTYHNMKFAQEGSQLFGSKRKFEMKAYFSGCFPIITWLRKRKQDDKKVL